MIFQLKSDRRENCNLTDFSHKITRISRVALHEFSCDSPEFSCNFSCKVHNFSCYRTWFFGSFATKKIAISHETKQFFLVKLPKKLWMKPRLLLHENSWRPTRDIRVILHEKSRKLQFYRVSHFNWKTVGWHINFYVISHEKSCTATFLKTHPRKVPHSQKAVVVIAPEKFYSYTSLITY